MAAPTRIDGRERRLLGTIGFTYPILVIFIGEIKGLDAYHLPCVFLNRLASPLPYRCCRCAIGDGECKWWEKGRWARPIEYENQGARGYLTLKGRQPRRDDYG
jgi:hypothetical protein